MYLLWLQGCDWTSDTDTYMKMRSCHLLMHSVSVALNGTPKVDYRCLDLIRTLQTLKWHAKVVGMFKVYHIPKAMDEKP